MNRLVYLVILSLGTALAATVYFNSRQSIESELLLFRNESGIATRASAEHVSQNIGRIYRALRTIARLPGVRSIEDKEVGSGMDHDGNTLDGDTRLAVQEIYNALAGDVAVSELYIVPVGLDPDGEDPQHLRPREPYVTYDEFIVGNNGGNGDEHSEEEELEEIEIYEYRLMRTQLDWMVVHHPTSASIESLDYPLLSGSPVVTCDNTRFDPRAPDDDDRSGLVLSIPFFDTEGSLRGCISAVILSHALSDMLSVGNEAVFIASHGYIVSSPDDGLRETTCIDANGFAPGDDLLYSEVVPVHTADRSAAWMFWKGRAAEAFWSRESVQATLETRNTGYGAVIMLTIVTLICSAFIRRAQIRLAQNNSTLEATVLERTSDLKDAMDAAKMADIAKSEFLANMSHEIRTPMAAILGFADSLSENAVEMDNIEATKTIQRNGVHLLAIINDLLDLSKIEAGKMPVEIAPVNPCELVADVASLLKIRAVEKGLLFEVEYVGDIPATIQTDAMRVRQILLNLVGNAIKFTEEGCIRLIGSLVEEEGLSRFQFDVVDTGIGMTPEQQDCLFRPFAQADTSTTRRFGGTGLGLTISKQFAELLGGEITIETTEVGVGTRFRVTVGTGSLVGVEMLDDPRSVSATSGDGQSKLLRADLKGKRILVAEDGPDMQRLVSFVLKKAGAEFVVVDNGKLALDAALAAREQGDAFDCILMDMQMPVMDGYAATGTLREQGYAGTIIALTAHAMREDQEKCMSAGCDAYATKPINRNELINLIARYSAERSAAA
jgi:signal transduction histidine kinase